MNGYNLNMEPRQLGWYDEAASQFAQDVWKLITKEGLLHGSPGSHKIVNFLQPSQLQKELDLNIRLNGASNAELLSFCEKLVLYGIKTGNPMFFNQLYSGADPYGTVAAWLMEALNTNEYTYEVAPAFTCITQTVLTKLNEMLGFHEGDGIFCAGGSMGNMMALSLARFRYDPELNKKGIFGSKRLVFFTSEDSHYSHQKGVAYLSFGEESLVKVKSNERGQISVDDLKIKIQSEKEKDHVPIAVLATSGSTVLGAYDDLNALADICEQEKLYLHVDACWGGGVMFSESKKHLLNGISRADSVVISMHKMMGIPLQCVPLLVKEKGVLKKCFSCQAPYIFQPDKGYDTSYDLGMKTVMCGRKPDALKLWLTWKARGDRGMSEHIDKIFHAAHHFKQKIEKLDGFRLVLPEFECTNICFWYIPPSMRGETEDEEWWNKLHLVAPEMKKRMMSNGKMLVGYQPLLSHGWVNFFRIIFVNNRITYEDIDKAIEEFETLGHDL